MTGILPFARRPLTANADVYPEFRPMVKALRARDWPTLDQLFADLPPEVDPNYPLITLAEVNGSEKFLSRLVDTERSSPLPRLLLGTRYIKMAWQARSGRLARYVSREQFEVFFEHLRRAEQVLGSVTGDEPDNAAAWSQRIVTARGLEFGAEEARRRYDKVAAVTPNPVYAQRQMIQTLCPKWAGSIDELVAFTRECVKAAPDGSMSAGLAVETNFERMADARGWSKFLREPAIAEECAEAERRSTGHPAWRELPGSILTHSSLAFYWSVTGQPAQAHPHFQAMGRRMVFPWPNALGDKAGARELRQRSADAKRAAR